jgi:hypothetical protein
VLTRKKEEVLSVEWKKAKESRRDEVTGVGLSWPLREWLERRLSHGKGSEGGGIVSFRRDIFIKQFRFKDLTS